jgi:DNA-binding IclR family transcriptional regulator
MGLQTLDRAVAALRVLGEHGDGLRLVDVQRQLKLSKPTTHRLLAALISHGFVQQDLATRLYRLGGGLDVFRWLSVQPAPDLKRASMPAVLALAEESGDTVFLVVRDRLESVCIARESGTYPIRAVTVDVGTRRPLGIGAGGIAILGGLEPGEAERIVPALAGRLGAFPFSSTGQILKSAEIARRAGYAVSDGYVAAGVRGVGVAIHDSAGAPIAAIGIAAIKDRMRTARIPELVDMLRRERDGIERELRPVARPPARTARPR